MSPVALDTGTPHTDTAIMCSQDILLFTTTKVKLQPHILHTSVISKDGYSKQPQHVVCVSVCVVCVCVCVVLCVCGVCVVCVCVWYGVCVCVCVVYVCCVCVCVCVYEEK